MKLMRLLLLTAVVAGTWTPLVLAFDPVAAHDQLLTEATGYFKHAGGTGGQGGSVYYVTNLNDGGSGSLRDALTRTEPLIILFENGLNGTINIASGNINVRSNKTVWGRHRDGSAADIFIHPTNADTPFKIEGGNKNIIISNLKGDAPGPNDAAPDFIEITGDGGLVWIHHVTVIGDGTDDMDGFVDVHAPNVTISWSRAEDWSAVHLFYPYPDPSKDVTLTMHHNLYRNNRDRMPRTSKDNTYAHAYNNWLVDWRSYGMRSTGGEIRAENNVFDAGSDTDAISGPWGGGGNYFTNGASASSPTSVFTPPYSYTLDGVSTSAKAQELRDRLEAESGWQSSIGTTPPPIPDLTPPSAPTNLRVR